MTALATAASFGHIETVKILVENGAYIKTTNDEKKTPLQLTKKEEIKKFIEEKLK